jgi:hypothetical protein
MRFWLNSGSITRHEVLEGKAFTNLINLMSYNGPNGSMKGHEILKGENLELAPSNDMRFLGPSKDMRWQKMGKICLGPSKDTSALYSGFQLFRLVAIIFFCETLVISMTAIYQTFHRNIVV